MKSFANHLLLRTVFLFSVTIMLLHPGLCTYAAQTLSFDIDGDLQQIGWSTTSATVTWSLKENTSSHRTYPEAAGCRIYVGTSSADARLTAVTSKNVYTIKGLTAGSSYYVKVVPCTDNGQEGIGKSSYSIRTSPGKVQGFKQSKWRYLSKMLKVEWSSISYADKYEITLYNRKNKKLKTITRNGASASSASFSGLQDNEIYYVSLRAIYKDLKQNTKKTAAVKIPCFTQARVTNITQKNGSLQIKWNKTAAASGYVIYLSASRGKGYKKIKTVGKKTDSITIRSFNGKKISKSKKYYVAIGTKYGKYTSGIYYSWCSTNMQFGYIS